MFLFSNVQKHILITCSAASLHAGPENLSTASCSSERNVQNLTKQKTKVKNKQKNKQIKVPLLRSTDSLKVINVYLGGVSTSWDGHAPPVVTESPT